MSSARKAVSRLQVAVPLALARPYDYAVPDGMDLQLGDYVRVPLGKREEIGVVWSLESDQSLPAEKLKAVLERYDLPQMPEVHRTFLSWVSRYTVSDLGSVLKMALSAPQVFVPAKGKRRRNDTPAQNVNPQASVVALSQAQKKAAEQLIASLGRNDFSVSLLDGVTGSGKTEVYFEAVAQAIEQGRQVLILLPEIALSAQFHDRFQRRFGAVPAIWHSEVTPAQRRQIWSGVAAGEVKVVVGARSALFLPFQNLGLIVVDEEHDAAYKQEDGVMYNARDMAIVRAQLGKIPCVLVSATPSLETMTHARSGKYSYLHLPERHGGATMPDVAVIDLKKNPPPRGKFMAPSLTEALAATLAAGEQSLLFLNRRGYAPLTLCRTCGHRFQCPSCSAWLVEHRKSGRLQCHHCGYGMKTPSACPSCHAEDALVACGPGVERIEEEVKALFPDARVLVLASDTAMTPKIIHAAIQDIEQGKVDVVIGTQMVAKGHHFPDLTLVGVIDADIGLAGGDLRAAERTFQLLHQVSGRAGRGAKKGRVMLQTYMPQQPVMRALAIGDRDAFLAAEGAEREKTTMPPFGRLAALIISAADEQKLDLFCRDLLRAAPRYDDIRVLGPVPAPIALLRGRHRRRFLVKAGKAVNMQNFLKEWLDRFKTPSIIQLKIDIDPQSFF